MANNPRQRRLRKFWQSDPKPGPGNDPPSAHRRRVREAWVSFEQAVLPADCSDVQRQEMRRAFYAGAFAVLDAIAAAMSDEADMTDGDERVMIDLAIEREEYIAHLRMGRA